MEFNSDNSLKHRLTGVTSGVGTAHPSGAPEFTPRFLVGFVLLDLLFHMYVLLIGVAPFTLKIFFVYFENKTRRNVIASNTSQSFGSQMLLFQLSHISFL
jgi:hypothetical protein